ncbi:hypothetical protein AB9K24_12285 [Meridianimaribacter flavus]
MDIKSAISDTESNTFWMWFAFGEILVILSLTIIVVILYKKLRNNNSLAFSDIDKSKLKENIRKSSVNMNDVMDSINHSKMLYRELSRSCHPDRFINTDKQNIADEIFQDISNKKRDYKALLKLKKRAENELNIKFK